MASESFNRLINKVKRKAARHPRRTKWLIRGVVSVSMVLLLYVTVKPVRSFFSQIIRGPKMVSTFFTDPLYTLPSYNGVTNVLFLGMGGEGHDGATLTDTMILFSLNLKTNSVNMLSIPRDIWVPSLEAKINSAYMLGENVEAGGGFGVMEDSVFEIIGMPIHYVVNVDFNSFKEIINIIGGVDVVVDKDFTDVWYPIKGKENDLCDGDPEYKCRYETISFAKGKQHLDGEMALKFSRSRHAEGEEGTDFARSQRQQKIISAIKDKVMSSKVLLNPGKLMELKEAIFKYVKFNKEINDKEFAGFASFAYEFYQSRKEVKTIVLETGDDDNPGFLINPSVEKYGYWVLEPRKGDWSEFQAFFKKKVEEEI